MTDTMSDTSPSRPYAARMAGHFIFILSVIAFVFVIHKFTNQGRDGGIGEYGDRARQFEYYKKTIRDLGSSFDYYRNENGRYPDDIRKLDPEYISVSQVLDDGETRPIDLKEDYESRNIRYHYISDNEFLIEGKIFSNCELRYSSVDKVIKEIGDCEIKQS